MNQQAYSSDYSIITIATNSLNYVDFALNCAQSVILHNNLTVYIITNLNFDIPAGLQNKVHLLVADEEQARLGIGIKAFVNQYLQTRHTLFIDSDCLCYGSLKPIFDACDGMDVTVAGTIVKAADWCGEEQAAIIEQKFNVTELPRFNGGLYYLRKSHKAGEIYELAQSIIPEYDSFGFHRIKNRWINEEGLIAIAMMLYNQLPIADDGRFMTDLSTDSHPAKLNVLTGSRTLRNPQAGQPRHRAWYPPYYSPILLHFGGSNSKSYIYRSQALLLKLQRKHMATVVASALVATFIHLPVKSLRWLLGLFRK